MRDVVDKDCKTNSEKQSTKLREFRPNFPAAPVQIRLAHLCLDGAI